MLLHPTSQPDILEVIADLSNDEVFTPPKVANAVLDLLPTEVWSDPTLRWLDPGCKTGVFLREVTRRLLDGLGGVIPDDEERLRHILTNMRDEKFALLVEAGVLSPGDTLFAVDGTAEAVVTEDFAIAVGGIRQETPDDAAAAASEGRVTDGWTFWTATSGYGLGTLAKLNELLTE